MSKPDNSPSFKRAMWLEAAVSDMRPRFAACGYSIPATLRVSVGWPFSKRKGRGGQTIGECWPVASSTDAHHEIFISPAIGRKNEDITILATLAHELGHACLPPKTGHRRPFAKLCECIGLDGKPTHTHAGDKFKAWAAEWIAKHGEWPGGALNTAQGPGKKQTTRLIKCECNTCGYTVRTTAKWLDDVGAPYCGVKSHGRMNTDHETEDGE
jgi:hypothetical protein